MKKNTLKKLQLSRETLRELEEKVSREAAGGRTCTSCVCDAPTNCYYVCG